MHFTRRYTIATLFAGRLSTESPVVAGVKARYSYGLQETAVDTQTPATVMATRTVYLRYQYLVQHRAAINLGI